MPSETPAEVTLYVAVLFTESVEGDVNAFVWRDIQLFTSKRKAQRWVETRLRTPVKWSPEADVVVVQGVEATTCEDPPARIHTVTIDNPERFARLIN